MNRLSHLMRVVALVVMTGALAGCAGFDLFAPAKITEEEIIPPETLYQDALKQMDRQNFLTAIDLLAKLERQHPYSEYSEKAKLMTVFAHFRVGHNTDTVLAADRYLALYPSSPEVPYIIYLKGGAYYRQIKDITRDQQLARDTIDTMGLILANYPDSKYAKDAKEMIVLATDQLAGKEMSVGRYYLGNNQPSAAVNRFRVVVENYQTSTHIEEALYRLTEVYLKLGLINEARSATAVLGHNYPSSEWYKRGFDLLAKQGLTPELVGGNWITNSAKS